MYQQEEEEKTGHKGMSGREQILAEVLRKEACIVRADCCLPNTFSTAGKTEVIAGDMAKPVRMISRVSTKTTPGR